MLIGFLFFNKVLSEVLRPSTIANLIPLCLTFENFFIFTWLIHKSLDFAIGRSLKRSISDVQGVSKVTYLFREIIGIIRKGLHFFFFSKVAIPFQVAAYPTIVLYARNNWNTLVNHGRYLLGKLVNMASMNLHFHPMPEFVQIADVDM